MYKKISISALREMYDSFNIDTIKHAGFTIAQVLSSDFMYLSHSVDLAEDFEKIIKSTHLSPLIYRFSKTKINQIIKLIEASDKLNFDLKIQYRHEQYPGVYITPEIKNKGLTNRSNFVFIISLSLLTKKGWHVRGSSPYGGYGSLVDKEVWDSTTFYDYLSTKDVKLDFPEMIFHYPIPLKYVEAIVCRDQKKNLKLFK